MSLPELARENSKKFFSLKGLKISESLPLLELASLPAQTTEDIGRRALCVFCVVSIANNADPEKVQQWAFDEALTTYFSSREVEYLKKPTKNLRPLFLAQEETLLAFAWALKIVEEMDLFSYCDASLAKNFPYGKTSNESRQFISQASLRDFNDLFMKLDLIYCLHWHINEAVLFGATRALNVEPYVTIERRRCLEWIIYGGDWDTIELDT